MRSREPKGTLVGLLVALLVGVGCGKGPLVHGRDASTDATRPQPVETGDVGAREVIPAVGDLAIREAQVVVEVSPVVDLPASEAQPDGEAVVDLAAGEAQPDGEAVVDLAASEAQIVVDTATGETPRDADADADAAMVRDVAGDPIRLLAEVGYSKDASGLADLCRQTGGTVEMIRCWDPPLVEFRETCNSQLQACLICKGTCTDVAYCACPNGGCFKTSYGCLNKNSGCTVGQDQTCNDNPLISSIHGKCVEGGFCQCQGYDVNPATGKRF